MGEFSAIEWTDHTFNPFIGCTKVSPGCDHCYAETFVSKRMGQPELWKGERRRTSVQNWNLPLRWNRKAEKEGRRYRVFCASLADVFDNQVPPEWRTDLFALIGKTPNLDWLLLTKRPQNIAKMMPAYGSDGWPNVWLGTTVENQEEADRRIPHLLSVPARVRFLSCEPLLGPVDLRKHFLNPFGFTETERWVIAGGESGPGARAMHPEWARSLRDQCNAAGVPFLFKQWGDWEENTTGHPISGGHVPRSRSTFESCEFKDGTMMNRVGKKRAGRLLDGVAHDEFPAPPATNN